MRLAFLRLRSLMKKKKLAVWGWLFALRIIRRSRML